MSDQLSMFDDPPPPPRKFVPRDELTWANLVILGVDVPDSQPAHTSGTSEPEE